MHMQKTRPWYMVYQAAPPSGSEDSIVQAMTMDCASKSHEYSWLPRRFVCTSSCLLNRAMHAPSKIARRRRPYKPGSQLHQDRPLQGLRHPLPDELALPAARSSHRGRVVGARPEEVDVVANFGDRERHDRR